MWAHLETSNDPFAALPANNDAMKNKMDVTAETNTHHSITPTDKFSLLYSIHTPDPPHADPCHSSQAPSMTLPINTGPGIEPERRDKSILIHVNQETLKSIVFLLNSNYTFNYYKSPFLTALNYLLLVTFFNHMIF